MNRLNEFREQVLDGGYGFIPSALLFTAFDLDIFEVLRDGQKSLATIREETQVDGRALEMLLNALTSLNWIQKQNGGYGLGQAGKQVFLKGSDKYIGDIIRLQRQSAENYMRLTEAIRSGKALGGIKDGFEAVSREVMESFIPAMHNTAMGHAEVLARKIHMKAAKSLLDLGGGPATFTIHFLKENPELHATVYDLPTVTDLAKNYVIRAGLLDRVTFQTGNFNQDPIQGTYDVVFVSHIIHGLDEANNERFFEKIANAINPGGRLIIQDFFLKEDGVAPQFSTFFALNMLLHTPRGRCYKFSEVENWMTKLGFHDIMRPAIRLPRGIALIIGKK